MSYMPTLEETLDIIRRRTGTSDPLSLYTRGLRYGKMSDNLRQWYPQEALAQMDEAAKGFTLPAPVIARGGVGNSLAAMDDVARANLMDEAAGQFEPNTPRKFVYEDLKEGETYDPRTDIFMQMGPPGGGPGSANADKPTIRRIKGSWLKPPDGKVQGYDYTTDTYGYNRDVNPACNEERDTRMADAQDALGRLQRPGAAASVNKPTAGVASAVSQILSDALTADETRKQKIEKSKGWLWNDDAAAKKAEETFGNELTKILMQLQPYIDAYPDTYGGYDQLIRDRFRGGGAPSQPQLPSTSPPLARTKPVNSLGTTMGAVSTNTMDAPAPPEVNVSAPLAESQLREKLLEMGWSNEEIDEYIQTKKMGG